jgi:hypothetical protein
MSQGLGSILAAADHACFDGHVPGKATPFLSPIEYMGAWVLLL